jgi:uncharacterized SAM-binding protein YcdF (DUF218 family)
MNRILSEQMFERASEQVNAMQLVIAQILSCDAPLVPLDAIVIHGLSEGMYASGDLLEHAVDLWKTGRTHRIAVVGGDGSPTGECAPGKSWVGSEFLVKYLTEQGVPREEIIVTDPITHTKEEAYAIVRMAQQHNFKRVGSVSVSYHGPRILHCLVAVMKELNHWIEWHMMLSPRTDWLLKMLGSQGKGMTNSLFAALDDGRKVRQYIDNGFAATSFEVLQYLCDRDRVVETQIWDFSTQQDH